MRKHKWVIAFVAIAVGLFAVSMAAAEVVLNPPQVSPLGVAIDPPEGAYVDIIDAGPTAIITVRGLDVFKNRVYVYGAGKIEGHTLVNGSVTIPARRWFNLAFKGSDGNFHYLLVDDDYRFVKPSWMGPGLGIKPNTGKGSALTARGWLAPEYR